MARLRKKWKLTYPGFDDIDMFDSERKTFEFIRALAASRAAGEPVGDRVLVWVDEQDGGGWCLFDEVHLAEVVPLGMGPRPEGAVMARPGYDGPIGRQFHGMEGDAPIFDSELLRVDRFSGGRFFVEVGRESGNTKLVNVGHGDLLRLARAILQHFEPTRRNDPPAGRAAVRPPAAPRRRHMVATAHRGPAAARPRRVATDPRPAPRTPPQAQQGELTMAERIDTTGMAFADRAEAVPMYRPHMTNEERAELYAALDEEADAAHRWYRDTQPDAE